MIEIVQAVMPDHEDQVRDLFAEYLRWVCPILLEKYRATFDPEAMIVHDMETIEVFLPPKGLLLLAFDEDSPAGCACTRTIGAGVAEMKRMYVRPDHRRRGIGARLVGESIKRAREAGHKEVRLDSAAFMHDAHRVYRSLGFAEIPPYHGSEIPEEYRKHWVFMRLSL